MKVAEFLELAKSDEALKEALTKATQKAKEDHIAAMLEIAKQFKIPLTKEDFDVINNEGLDQVDGGAYYRPITTNCSNCAALCT
jgi:hypothetical protein